MQASDLNHAEAIAKSEELIQVLTPEKQALLLSLMPNVEKLTAATTRHQASYAGLLKGIPEMAKACEADLAEVTKQLAQFHGMVKTCAIADPTVLEMLGLAPAGEKTSAGHVALTEPRDVKLTYNNQGRPVLSFSKVPGSKGCQIWISDGDPSVEANWRLLDSSSNCRGIVLSVDRTAFHWLKVRANRGKEVGPWSAAISIPNS
jgi:hypothetical protein